MKRIALFACCLLLMSGCSQRSAGSDPVSEPAAATVQEESAEIEYKDISIGGFMTKIPNEWTVDDNFIYYRDAYSYPYIYWTMLDDSLSYDEMFSYDGAEKDYTDGVSEGLFGGSSYSASELEVKQYDGLESHQFITTGFVDGQAVTGTYDLFEDPRGGLLVLSFITNHKTSDSAKDVRDYLNVIYDMAPSADPAPAAGGNASEASESSSAGSHFYDTAIVKDVMNGTRTEKLGEYSVAFTTVESMGGDVLADWYLNYVKKHDFNYAIIVFTDMPGYGVFETYGAIEFGDKIEQDEYGDYYAADNSEATFVSVEDDGTITELTD